MTNPYRHLVVTCLSAVLCGCSMEGPADATDAAEKAQAPRSARSYDCDDGFRLVAEFRPDEDSVFVFLPDGGRAIPRVRSGSGTRNEEPADGVTLWEKGPEVSLTTADGTTRRCVENRRGSIVETAKLAGADYWATGNEPGWTLEIYPDRILFVTDYGQARYEAPVSAPVVDDAGRTATYFGPSRGGVLVVTIRGERCADSMSGESFEGTIEVKLGDRSYTGCGQPLH